MDLQPQSFGCWNDLMVVPRFLPIFPKDRHCHRVEEILSFLRHHGCLFEIARDALVDPEVPKSRLFRGANRDAKAWRLVLLERVVSVPISRTTQLPVLRFLDMMISLPS